MFYILRLLAGKLKNICTAFPLTAFFDKNLNGVPIEFFPPIKSTNHLEHKQTIQIDSHHLSFSKNHDFESSKYLFVFKMNNEILLIRACLHGGGGPQVGEITRLGGVTRLSI